MAHGVLADSDTSGKQSYFCLATFVLKKLYEFGPWMLLNTHFVHTFFIFNHIVIIFWPSIHKLFSAKHRSVGTVGLISNSMGLPYKPYKHVAQRAKENKCCGDRVTEGKKSTKVVRSQKLRQTLYDNDCKLAIILWDIRPSLCDGFWAQIVKVCYIHKNQTLGGMNIMLS